MLGARRRVVGNMLLPVQAPCVAVVRTKWPTVGFKPSCSIGASKKIFTTKQNTVTSISWATIDVNMLDLVTRTGMLAPSS